MKNKMYTPYPLRDSTEVMMSCSSIAYMPSGSMSFGYPGMYCDGSPDPEPLVPELVICLYCGQLVSRIAGGCMRCGGRIAE